jgi:hypothetical protein
MAENLVQDAFAHLVGRLRQLREPNAFDAYLRRTIVTSPPASSATGCHELDVRPASGGNGEGARHTR